MASQQQRRDELLSAIGLAKITHDLIPLEKLAFTWHKEFSALQAENQKLKEASCEKELRSQLAAVQEELRQSKEQTAVMYGKQQQQVAFLADLEARLAEVKTLAEKAGFSFVPREIGPVKLVGIKRSEFKTESLDMLTKVGKFGKEKMVAELLNGFRSNLVQVGNKFFKPLAVWAAQATHPDLIVALNMGYSEYAFFQFLTLKWKKLRNSASGPKLVATSHNEKERFDILDDEGNPITGESDETLPTPAN